jgi:hypothetical protein
MSMGESDIPTADVPDSCLNDDHDFGQAGRCRDCGVLRVDTTRSWEDRRSGGAGSTTHALTNGEYREQMRKLDRD